MDRTADEARKESGEEKGLVIGDLENGWGKILIMKIGDKIHVQARKTDGTIYRSWDTVIEFVDAGSLVTISPAGSPVFNIKGENYPIRHHYRSYYWFTMHKSPLYEYIFIINSILQLKIQVE